MEERIRSLLDNIEGPTKQMVSHELEKFKDTHLKKAAKRSLRYECCDDRVREDFVRRLLKPVHDASVIGRGLDFNNENFINDQECVQVVKRCETFDKVSSLYAAACTGKALDSIRDRQPNRKAFLFVLREHHNIHLSESYIYFLISFANMSTQHPDILRANANIGTIRAHFALIRKFF